MTNTIRIPKFKIKKEKIDSDKTVHIEYDQLTVQINSKVHIKYD